MKKSISLPAKEIVSDDEKGKKFICDVCGHKFLAPDIKWQGTPYSQPMPCPRCGSCHTMPKSFFSFIDKFIYKKIWEDNDNE